MKVSFDMDGCIGDVAQMERLAQLLTSTSADVYILTSRFDHTMKNIDVWAIAEKCGIKKENVLICNGREKADLIKEHSIALHIDDDVLEVDVINMRPELNCVAMLINFKLLEVLHYHV